MSPPHSKSYSDPPVHSEHLSWTRKDFPCLKNEREKDKKERKENVTSLYFGNIPFTFLGGVHGK